MSTAALRIRDYAEAELAALAEHIERRAWFDLIEAAPPWLRQATGACAETLEGGALMLSAPGLDHLLFNRVIGLGEHSPATAEQIDAILSTYWDRSAPRYWVHVGPYARPARLGRMLQEHGLEPYRRSWVKFVRPAQRSAAAHTELTIRRARVADATSIASIVGMAFDLPQRGAELFCGVVGRRRWDVYVAERNGEIAAAAGMYIDGEVAYMAFAATRPEFRRQGAQRALLEVRLNAATDADCRWIASETGFPLTADEPNPSYRNFLWAGFRPVAIRDNYAPPGVLWAHGG